MFGIFYSAYLGVFCINNGVFKSKKGVFSSKFIEDIQIIMQESSEKHTVYIYKESGAIKLRFKGSISPSKQQRIRNVFDYSSFYVSKPVQGNLAKKH